MVCIKKILVAVLSVILSLSFVGCSASPDGEKTTNHNDVTTTQKTDETSAEDVVYEFSEDKLFEVNSISELLKTHKSVKVIDKHDGSENIQQFFLYDGKTVFAQKWTGENGNTLTEGWIKGFFVEYADGQYNASVNVNEFTGADAECPYDGAITFAISEYEIELIDETADSFILSLSFEGQSDDVIHKCTVDKKTHVVTNIHYETSDGYTAITDCVYDEDVDDFGLTKGFDDTKTVTMHINTITDGKEENKTVEYNVPSDWMLTPSIYDDYTLYSNAEYTQLFEYPGHGENYTIYATNLKG